MKIKLSKIMTVVFIMLIILGAIYFIIKNHEKDSPKNQEVTYQTVNMITNIRLGLSNFDTINPYVTNNREVLYLSQLIFEPLVTISEDYKIKPCLAKEWSKIEDTIYVIKLQQNVKWEDETNFTAQDVKFSIESLKKQPNSSFYENVKDIKNVEIIDDYTIRIELNKKIPFFEYQLIFPILSSKQYENKSIETASIIPQGTGQYKIANLKKEYIELEINNNWWNMNNKTQNNKKIYINLYETMGEVYNSFKVGNIDFIHTSNTNIEEYIGSLGYKRKYYSNREFDYLALNCKNTILQYSEIRKAIKTIVNTNKIANVTLEGKVNEASFPIIEKNYLIEDNIKEKITKNAFEILKEAGWKYEYNIWQKEIDGVTKTINIELIVNEENEQRLKVSEELKMQLENFGILVNLNKVSKERYEQVLESHEYEMLITGVYSSVSPELYSFFGENNIANYENSEIQKLLNEIDTNLKESGLREKYKRILEIYNEEVPYIGLYRNKDLIVYSNNLIGEIAPSFYSIYDNIGQWYRQ